MHKDCEDIMEAYLMLGKGAHVPLHITLHLLACPRCRNEVRMLSRAEKLSAKPLSIPTPLENGTIASVLSQIDPSYSEQENKVSIRQWVITGIIIIAAMLILELLAPEHTNSLLSFVTHMAFASILTVYCVIFIGTNLDFFVKKADVYRNKLQESY